MSFKIFGLLITSNAVLKALEAGAISTTEAAVSALLNSDDANARAVAAAVEAKIQALDADKTSTGLQKLELAAEDAVQVLVQFGFSATKDFAIQLVQTIYTKGRAEPVTIGHEILEKLGLEKAAA